MLLLVLFILAVVRAGEILNAPELLEVTLNHERAYVGNKLMEAASHYRRSAVFPGHLSAELTKQLRTHNYTVEMGEGTICTEIGCGYGDTTTVIW